MGLRGRRHLCVGHICGLMLAFIDTERLDRACMHWHAKRRAVRAQALELVVKAHVPVGRKP